MKQRLQRTVNSTDNTDHVWQFPAPCPFPSSVCSSALMQRSAPWWKADCLGTARMAKPSTSSTAAATTRGVSRQRPRASGERSLPASVKIWVAKVNWRNHKVWVNQGISRRAVILLWAWPPLSRIPLRACSKSQVRSDSLFSLSFYMSLSICLSSPLLFIFL